MKDRIAIALAIPLVVGLFAFVLVPDLWKAFGPADLKAYQRAVKAVEDAVDDPVETISGISDSHLDQDANRYTWSGYFEVKAAFGKIERRYWRVSMLQKANDALIVNAVEVYETPPSDLAAR